MTLAKACEILQLDERRIQRWIKLAEEGCYTRQSACDAKPHVPYNALTPEQKAVLEQYLAAKEYADASAPARLQGSLSVYLNLNEFR
jgi:Spy/CpxP family protein refolding chaperone